VLSIGGDSGIGAEITKGLLLAGFRVILGVFFYYNYLLLLY
jgi:NAD(P)-dependent dehydrogenase (short-subunit alcohol dehydrogenase family)